MQAPLEGCTLQPRFCPVARQSGQASTSYARPQGQQQQQPGPPARPQQQQARCSGVCMHAATLEAAPAVQRRVEVDLGDRSYPIYIGTALLDQPGLLQQHVAGKQVLVVTNTTIAPLYLDRCVAALSYGRPDLVVETLVLPDGEQYKSLDVVSRIWDAALERRLDRKATFVALGGGVIGDMVGFGAAAYQRGVAFIQVPTSVMATVDSSVGGKTGVNHPLGKNMVGAFHQPRAVLVDTATLRTLPRRELASGFSEVVKYGLIRDAELFCWLEEHAERLLSLDAGAVMHAIEASCLNKAAVVAADEREAGLRATLNLGHTFGHAIETWQGYGVWLHGEAVAAGMVMAAHMSHRMGWIEESILARTVALLKRLEQPIEPPEGMTAGDFTRLMAVDKKVASGKLRLILLKGPLGGCVFTGDFDPQALEATLAHFCH